MGLNRLLTVCLTVSLAAVLAISSSPVSVSFASESDRDEAVVLLHGLARTERAMAPMADFLRAQGYAVINQGYPSRDHDIEILTGKAIPPALEQARARGARRIHFVTHSLGGILVRQYLKDNELPALGRVVMLGPPSQGSEAVDKLQDLAPFQWLNGPAGQQLGTGVDSVPIELGPADFDVGVIAGNFSINLLLSRLIPGEDDGKVSVERAKLAGMNDFLIVPYSHPLMMRRDRVMRQVLHYLRHGHFDHSLE